MCICGLYTHHVLPRFFAPDAGRSAEDPVVVLPAEEAAHLSRVLRLTTGDSVRVFNGRGDEWQATVREVKRQRVVVTLVDKVAAARESRISIALAVAVLKADKMDRVIRDAVMLGVAEIEPLVTERTETSLSAVMRGTRAARWQRIAMASVKQCGRAVVPLVKLAVSLPAWIDTHKGTSWLMLVEPGAGAEVRELREIRGSSAVTVMIGPEGGWTSEELQRAAAAGATLVTLGSRTLRADAAPIVALTAFRTLWDDL